MGLPIAVVGMVLGAAFFHACWNLVARRVKGNISLFAVGCSVATGVTGSLYWILSQNVLGLARSKELPRWIQAGRSVGLRACRRGASGFLWVSKRLFATHIKGARVEIHDLRSVNIFLRASCRNLMKLDDNEQARSACTLSLSFIRFRHDAHTY
eukprot:gene24407-biopygen10016